MIRDEDRFLISSGLVRHLILLFRLWVRPGAAMGEILDRGSLLFASLTAIAAGLLTPSVRGLHFYTPLLVLAVIYVPGLLLLGSLLAHTGAVGTAFQRDYSSLLTCVAMGWSAAQLPIILAQYTAPPEVLRIVAAVGYAYFAVLVFFAVRTVFGTGSGAAVAIVGMSWLSLAAAAFLWGPLSMIFGLLASPFFLFFIIYYLGAEFSRLGAGLRTGQNYRRMLEAAAINPHDGDAQYQLGLIHQQRHQYTEAIRRFEAAVAIDPTETDAQFQLGRMAREQARTDEALKRFEIVLKQDEKHSSSEVHRELGAVYLALGRNADAERELALYTERREYDPEGLYYYGQALQRSGKADAAQDIYARAVEAARTAPRYRRHLVAKWSRLAQKALR